jgi:hypothetical protein
MLRLKTRRNALSPPRAEFVLDDFIWFMLVSPPLLTQRPSESQPARHSGKTDSARVRGVPARRSRGRKKTLWTAGHKGLLLSPVKFPRLYFTRIFSAGQYRSFAASRFLRRASNIKETLKQNRILNKDREEDLWELLSDGRSLA